MSEVDKLIEYATISGFSLSTDGNTLYVKNGRQMSDILKELIIEYKYQIIEVLENN